MPLRHHLGYRWNCLLCIPPTVSCLVSLILSLKHALNSEFPKTTQKKTLVRRVELKHSFLNHKQVSKYGKMLIFWNTVTLKVQKSRYLFSYWKKSVESFRAFPIAFEHWTNRLEPWNLNFIRNPKEYFFFA